ncbi:beta-carotene 15,15'-monooxygenase, partial [Halobacteriales archaeon QS_8_69_73]
MDSTPGFHSLTEERTASLAVEGSLPGWLDGGLVRNGPGAFSVGGDTVDHWFDGLAMCYRFGFDPGNRAGGAVDAADAVHYRNRFLETDAYRK